jgi:mRNA-degrading endonuclease RelE of RelBE toxin-antitoxin system
MTWGTEYLPETDKDIERLDGSVRRQVYNIIEQAAKNPLL